MLILSDTVRSELMHLVHRGYPYETCGLLLGRRDGEDSDVSMIFSARNLNRARAEDRYLLDPKDFLRADRVARADGREILGVWHSHPDHPAAPSATDHEHAWPDWSYLILSVSRDGVRTMRSWRLDREGQFAEETIGP